MARKLTKIPSQSPPPTDSPPKFKFNFSFLNTKTTSTNNNNSSSSSAYSSPMKNTNKKKISSVDQPSVIISPAPVTMTSLTKAPNAVADLKEVVAVSVDSIKRHLEFSHSEIVKDIEAADSRLSKRFKIQNQACQQTMNEAEKEFKKMSDQITESRDAMQASYKELIAESQASANRVCKTTIPELLQSVDRALDGLNSRYGIA